MRRLLALSIISLCLATTAYGQTVDIIWQGETYTPPFSKSRSLWSNQSKLTLWAVPQGASLSNSNYRWTKNGTVLGSLSGIGKNILTVNDTVLSKPQNIKVELVSGDGNVLAESSALVTPIAPNIVIYENNPLYGVMFHSETVGSHVLKENEVTFSAFPFFFTATNRSDNTLNYKWQTNTGGVETNPSVTYRATERSSGRAVVSASITNPVKILQTASKNFSVEFGGNE